VYYELGCCRRGERSTSETMSTKAKPLQMRLSGSQPSLTLRIVPCYTSAIRELSRLTGLISSSTSCCLVFAVRPPTKRVVLAAAASVLWVLAAGSDIATDRPKPPSIFIPLRTRAFWAEACQGSAAWHIGHVDSPESPSLYSRTVYLLHTFGSANGSEGCSRTIISFAPCSYPHLREHLTKSGVVNLAGEISHKKTRSP